MLRRKGVQVDILEDSQGIAFFKKYWQEKPNQVIEDCNGLAAVNKSGAPNPVS